MNLLITGGLGYIGSAVAMAAANSSDDRIVVFSRSAANAGLSLGPRIVYEVGSILDADRVREVLEQYEITHVVHAAGARTSECVANPGLAIESNVIGTRCVFEAARRVGLVESVVFLSSAAVYGKILDPVGEETTLAPGSAYAIAKAAAEFVALGVDDLDTTIVRPGFVMGLSVAETWMKSRLNSYAKEALDGKCLEMRLPRGFFVHEVGDLARRVVTTLRAGSRGVPRALNLPGYAIQPDEFAEHLRESARELGANPEISVKLDTELAVPAVLRTRNYERIFGGEPLPPFREVVRGMMSQLVGGMDA